MRTALTALSAVLLVVGCAAEPQSPDTFTVDLEARRTTTYFVRQDFRRCAWPFCGGYWVSEANAAETNCGRGERASECYVTRIDWSASGLSEAQTQSLGGGLLVDGLLGSERVASFGRLGVLVAHEAFAPLDDLGPDGPEGTFYEVTDNGIRCITTPCYSVDATELNGNATVTLSGLDLDGVDPAAASEALAAGNLRVAGTVAPDSDGGLVLTANAAWGAVAPAACVSGSDCTLSAYTREVTSRDECYCTTCPAPMSVEEAQANQASWENYCSAVRLICPLVLCAAPPPVACVDGECGYSFDSI